MDERKVIMHNIVFRWEEKAPFCKSGKSVQGALEYNGKTDQLRCHECGEWWSDIGHHLRSHKMRPKEYRKKHFLWHGSRLVCPARSRKLSLIRRAEIAGGRIVPRYFDGHNGHSGVKLPGIEERRNMKLICRLQLKARLKRICAQLGRAPFWQEFLNGSGGNDKLTPDAVRSSLNTTYTEFLVECGVPSGNRRVADAVLLEALRDFYVDNRRLPVGHDWCCGILPKRDTYKEHFGSLEEAYRRAGLVLCMSEAIPPAQAVSNG
jgi:hypothetical protein